MVRKTLWVLLALSGVFIVFSCGEDNIENDLKKEIFTNTSQWNIPSDGLPRENFEFSGIAYWNNHVVTSISSETAENSGIYLLDNGSFRKIVGKANRYGTGKPVVTSNGRLVTEIAGNFWELTGAEGNYAWNKLPLEKEFSSHLNYIPDNQGKIIIHSGTTDPVIYRYNPEDGTVTNLDFPYTGLDGKPHVSLHVAPSGAIWYKSNYSGIFRYENGNWNKERDNSGALTIAPDGTVYLSYEVKQYTQISTFFKYLGNGEWQQVQVHQGYGIGGEPFGTKNHIIGLSGRFGQFIMSPDKKWMLPSLQADLNLPADQNKGVRIAHSLTKDGKVYVVQDVGIDGINPRFMSYRPDTSALPYYTSNVALNTGTYLPSGSEATATGILADGRIAIALNADPAQFSQTPVFMETADEGDRGIVLLLGQNATSINNVWVVDDKLYDLDVAEGSNQIAVAGKNHYGLIDAGNKAFIWYAEYQSDKKRIATNRNNDAAVLISNSEVRLHSASGEKIFEREHKRSYIEDIEMHTSGIGYYLAGFDNKDLPGGNPVQVAFLGHYDNDGNREWFRFGFKGSNLSDNIADTRLYRVKYGHDGMLHILGESAGSQTIFRYGGESYSGDPMITQIDFFNALWNTASAHIAYHAKLNPQDGAIEHSQLTMSRLSGGKSNTFRTGDITADKDGSVFINGRNSYRLANRTAQRINGNYVGEYNGDPSLLALTSDYKNRHAWTTFSEDRGSGKGVAIATDNNKIVSVYNTTEGQLFCTPDAISNQGGEGVYVAVIPIKGNLKD